MTPSPFSSAQRLGPVDGFNALAAAMTTPFAAAVAVSAYNVRLVSNSMQFWMEAFARSYPASQPATRGEQAVETPSEKADERSAEGSSELVLPKRPGAASMLVSPDRSEIAANANVEEGAKSLRRRHPKVARTVEGTGSEPLLFDAAPITNSPANELVDAVMPAPTVIDDLKAISGIGPKIAQVLKTEGVTSFATIAAWTEQDIARFDDLFGLSGRITRDDWVGQASKLIATKED